MPLNLIIGKTESLVPLLRYKNAARGEGDVGGNNSYLQEALEQVERERKALEEENARLRVQLVQ